MSSEIQPEEIEITQQVKTSAPLGGRDEPASRKPVARRKSRITFWVRITLLLTCLVTLIGAEFSLERSRGTSHISSTPSLGSFVRVPLSDKQINSLHQLAKRLPLSALADMYVSRMTLDQKLGQLFIAQYWGYNYSGDVESMVRDLSVGGVIVYGAQMTSFQQAKDDITNMQNHAWMPLFIAADEEGGFVERIQNVFGHRPGALEMYQTGRVSNAAKLGHSIAHDLKSLGINTDLAPDVDVPLVNGPDQYLRTWGYTPESVITYGGAYLRAIQSDGEVGCIKHFPGLGAALTDAHAELPVVKRSREEIFSTELAPFAHFIQSANKLDRPGMIMSTDVLMPAIDPVWPAELSHIFITDILRNQLGYKGVILTDALYMKGISKKWDLPAAVVLALQAGNDMILGAVGADQVRQAINGIKQAINDRRLSVERINESVERIVTLKLSTHLWPSPELSII